MPLNLICTHIPYLYQRQIYKAIAVCILESILMFAPNNLLVKLSSDIRRMPVSSRQISVNFSSKFRQTIVKLTSNDILCSLYLVDDIVSITSSRLEKFWYEAIKRRNNQED